MAGGAMRIALGIEYNGALFKGWQSQDDVRTVQDEIEKALARVADHEVRVITAGRTDSGVHASGQVVHFDTGSVRSDNEWLRGTNSYLDRDVRVSWASPVDESFHARFSAISRSYRYIVLSRKIGSALFYEHACLDYREFNLDWMRDAARAFVGQHDFSAFRAAGCQAKSPVRQVNSLEINQSDDWFWFDINANAFLQHMVRNVAGVLFSIGAGERPVQWARDVLKSVDRTQGGVTAAPYGLYLTRVEYPENFELPGNPVTVRFWD
jgi:tRNA pseudouridine38-40 synthase